MSITETDFNHALTELGSYVPIRHGSITMSNGVGSVAWTAGKSGLGIIQTADSGKNSFIKAGVIQFGEKSGYFDKDEQNIIFSGSVVKIQVQYGGEWYDVLGSSVNKVGNNEIYRKVILKRA